MQLFKCVLTGCDKNTEWTLKWFIDNYCKHNSIPICFANFGVTEEMLDWIHLQPIVETVIDVIPNKSGGWFLKPQAMMRSPYEYTCWIDTDCHVLGDISGIFNYVEPNKLAMVEDLPWSARRGEKWHNSGVVAFKNKPPILKEWVKKSDRFVPKPNVENYMPGDQDMLHLLVMESPLKRMVNIVDLPNKYNVMRVQHEDGTAPKDAVIHHWTGYKGKLVIDGLINGS